MKKNLWIAVAALLAQEAQACVFNPSYIAYCDEEVRRARNAAAAREAAATGDQDASPAFTPAAPAVSDAAAVALQAPEASQQPSSGVHPHV